MRSSSHGVLDCGPPFSSSQPFDSVGYLALHLLATQLTSSTGRSESVCGSPDSKLKLDLWDEYATGFLGVLSRDGIEVVSDVWGPSQAAREPSGPNLKILFSRSPPGKPPPTVLKFRFPEAKLAVLAVLRQLEDACAAWAGKMPALLGRQNACATWAHLQSSTRFPAASTFRTSQRPL